MEIVDNRALSRFEVVAGDEIAIAAYRLDGNTITLTHTEVPDSMRGQGVGKALARAALDSARERNLTVVPLCPFMAGFISRHPEYQDLVGTR